MTDIKPYNVLSAKIPNEFLSAALFPCLACELHHSASLWQGESRNVLESCVDGCFPFSSQTVELISYPQAQV